MEILLRFEALKLRALLRRLRDYPASALIGALLAVGVLAAARQRLAQAPELVAWHGLMAAMIGIAAGWAATTAATGRWLPALCEGPLGHVAAAGRTAATVAVIRILLICACIYALTLCLLLDERGGVWITGGYVAGAGFGAALSAGLSLFRSSMKPRVRNPEPAGRRFARPFPAQAVSIVVHLRRPGRSWGAGLSALALALTGTAAGQLGPREGVEVGQLAWLAAQMACGLVVLAPHTSLLRIAATRPQPLSDLYSDLMLNRIALQFGAALLSGAFVFDRPPDFLAWAIAATVGPALIATVQFFYGLSYEKTVAELCLARDLGVLALMTVFIGPFMLAAILPWLWHLFARTDRMRWGRL